MTNEINETNNTTLVVTAYCNIEYVNDTIDPSICEDWYIIEYDDEMGNLTIEIGDDLVVKGAICEISDNC